MFDPLTADFFTAPALAALLQVVLIDLVFAGDNAVVIGLAAAALPPRQRTRAILIGIVAATALRVGLASLARGLLQIVGLLLAGGILLLWVAWKMWRELRHALHAARADGASTDPPCAGAQPVGATTTGRKTLAQAVRQTVVADVSMSLDNVLAVAGAARDHPFVLVLGLVLSIALMGLAANLIARLLNRQRWIGYLGLAVILYVALDMIYRGALEIWSGIGSAAPT